MAGKRDNGVRVTECVNDGQGTEMSTCLRGLHVSAMEGAMLAAASHVSTGFVSWELPWQSQSAYEHWGRCQGQAAD